MMVTGIWNNTVLIQRPRSAPYIGGKGRSHATEHNWFHSVNLLEQRKYLVLFISSVEIEDPSIQRMHSSRPISRVREARKASQTVGTVCSREMILDERKKEKKNYSNYRNV